MDKKRLLINVGKLQAISILISDVIIENVELDEDDLLLIKQATVRLLVEAKQDYES